DDDSYLGIHCPGSANHQITGYLVHGFHPEVRPGLSPFSSYIRRFLCVREEKVVENDVVEQLCGHLGDMLHVLSIFRLCVSERSELAIIVVRKADRSSDFDPLARKKLFDFRDQRRLGELSTPVRLQINLIYMQLASNDAP